MFVFTDFVNRADIRMIQGGSCLGFTLESGQGLGVARDFVGKKLEGNETVKSDVLRLVDNTHPAATELLEDAVMRDCLAEHWAEMLGLQVRQVNERGFVGCIFPSRRVLTPSLH